MNPTTKTNTVRIPFGALLYLARKAFPTTNQITKPCNTNENKQNRNPQVTAVSSRPSK
jgi:hypothetical protein